MEHKWNSYACYPHYVSGTMHVIYIVLFLAHINNVYLLLEEDDGKDKIIYAMLVCQVYACVYDMKQLCSQGFLDYFADPWNYNDQAHIWVGFANLGI